MEALLAIAELMVAGCTSITFEKRKDKPWQVGSPTKLVVEIKGYSLKERKTFSKKIILSGIDSEEFFLAEPDACDRVLSELLATMKLLKVQ